VAFGDLRTAAYCLRKCYYRRRDGVSVPEEVAAVRDLATAYPRLLAADDAALAAEPIEPPPEEYRERLAATKADCDAWDALVAPAATDELLVGRECHGVASKVLADPPRPSLVSPGRPPERGVWEPQSVWAVAAAKALAWEREREVERAYVEYPAHGVVRTVPLTTRRKAVYRRTLRAVRGIDGPPPRVENREKCAACEYSDSCGVRTRTLASLLPGSG